MAEIRRARRTAKAAAVREEQSTGDESRHEGIEKSDREAKLHVKLEPMDDQELPSKPASTTSNVKKEETDHEVERFILQEVFEHLTDEEIKARIQALSNPNAKFKKELEFDYEVVYDRLKRIGTEWHKIDLDEATRYHTFSRYYISALYGGGTVDTFPKIDPEKAAIHGVDNFCFPSLEFNPHAPKHPGAPGMFFICGLAPTGYRFRDSRTFVRLDASQWLYCGTYRFVPSHSLTPFEFQNQPERVQRRWAKELKAKKWGLKAISRIHIRGRYKREPLEEEIANIVLDRGETNRVLNAVTEEDVMEAFKHGDEQLGVYTMKCIGYDASWQQFLVDNYQDWKTEYEKRMKDRKVIRLNNKSTANRRSKNASPAATHQQKKLAQQAVLTEELPDASDSELTELEDVDADSVMQNADKTEGESVDSEGGMDEDDDLADDQEIEVLRTVARGTRSRPRGTRQEPIMID